MFYTDTFDTEEKAGEIRISSKTKIKPNCVCERVTNNSTSYSFFDQEDCVLDKFGNVFQIT